jgi:hypothetical protein
MVHHHKILTIFFLEDCPIKRALYVGQYEIGFHYKGVHLFILMGWDRGIINTLMFNVENLYRGPKYEVWLIASVVKGVTFSSYFL